MAEKNTTDAKKKKKKPSLEERHRNLQDQVAAIPYVEADLEAQGKRRQLFLLRWIQGPILRFQKKLLDKQRYGGAEGQKLKQKEQMKRHLDARRKQMEFYQGEMQRQQKRASKRNKTR